MVQAPARMVQAPARKPSSLELFLYSVVVVYTVFELTRGAYNASREFDPGHRHSGVPSLNTLSSPGTSSHTISLHIKLFAVYVFRSTGWTLSSHTLVIYSNSQVPDSSSSCQLSLRLVNYNSTRTSSFEMPGSPSAVLCGIRALRLTAVLETRLKTYLSGISKQPTCC